MTHLHFVIWCATDKVGDSYSGVTYVDIIAESMTEATARAMHLCPNRKYYWVNNIVEHQNTDKED